LIDWDGGPVIPDDLNFFRVDQILDQLLALGIRPFLELSFMPAALASTRDSYFFYGALVSPPKSYTAWGQLVELCLRHWAERYGLQELAQWHFEVWNEPNLGAFWKGTRDDYFRLYEESARAVKRVHPSLRVGGPATADGAWFPEFNAFCRARDAPVDFFTTHIYPSDEPVLQFREQRSTDRDAGYIQRRMSENKAIVDDSPYAGRPIHLTEFNSSTSPFDGRHDQINQAAFIAHHVHTARATLDSMAWWTIDDVFEEMGFPDQEFHGGFGLMTINGVRKPAWNAYRLLHMMGDRELPLSVIRGGFSFGQGAWVGLHGASNDPNLQALVWNYVHPHETGERTTQNLGLRLRVPSAAGIGNSLPCQLWRIDADHTNPIALWAALGSPPIPNPSEMARLREEGQVKAEPWVVRTCDGPDNQEWLEIKLEVPAGGVHLMVMGSEGMTENLE
jgi:xylan 1,4-beta-xylosidase